MPILKKPCLDSELLKNYRPILNLPFLSKVLEKTVYVALSSYLEDNNLPEIHQSAYKPHHSTETCLLKVQNDILLGMDRQHISLLVLLDLYAASDTVDHEMLLERLTSRLGIRGKVLLCWTGFDLTLVYGISGSKLKLPPLSLKMCYLWSSSRVRSGSLIVLHLRFASW